MVVLDAMGNANERIRRKSGSKVRSEPKR